jgi:hypothetical protein
MGRIAGQAPPRGYADDSLLGGYGSVSYRPPDNGGPGRSQGQGTRMEQKPDLTAYQPPKTGDGSGGPGRSQGQGTRMTGPNPLDQRQAQFLSRYNS